MGRPRKPRISRRRVLELALQIIDEEGLDAVSIRRLGERLEVNGASLYYHFPNKDAIINGAAELALEDVQTPETPNTSWRTWLPANARRLREALVKHPELTRVINRRQATGMGMAMLDSSAERLIAEGVPTGAVMPMLEALQSFAVGSAIHAIHVDRSEDQSNPVNNNYVKLAKVTAERGLSSDEIFDLVNASILHAIDETVKQRQAQWLPAALVGETGGQ